MSEGFVNRLHLSAERARSLTDQVKDNAEALWLDLLTTTLDALAGMERTRRSAA